MVKKKKEYICVYIILFPVNGNYQKGGGVDRWSGLQDLCETCMESRSSNRRTKTEEIEGG